MFLSHVSVINVTCVTGFNTNVESFGAVLDYGGADDSFSGGDDGPGFEFADNGDEDFVINELEGVRKVDKIQVGYATVAKTVDVKRLKKDLWSELETNFVTADKENEPDEDMEEDEESKAPITDVERPKFLSFRKTVQDMEVGQAQGDVTLPFYFICLLHLANEKGLRLESNGLEDFLIAQDNGAAPSFGTLPKESASGKSTTTIAEQRERRTKELATYQDMESDEDTGSDSK
jgi:condensin complex subunit 2